MAELRGLPSLPIAELDARLDYQRAAADLDWAAAQHREAVIRNAIDGSGPASNYVSVPRH